MNKKQGYLKFINKMMDFDIMFLQKINKKVSLFIILQIFLWFLKMYYQNTSFF